MAAFTAAGAVCLPLLVAPSVATAVTTPGGNGLGAVGPIDHSNGYPFWYEDKGLDLPGTADDQDPLRLELCLEADMCGAEIPDPTTDIKFPENYPDEGFWWAAEAEIEDAPGDRAMLGYAQEAAFGDAGGVAVGKQIAFTRQRVRVDGLVPNATYRVTTPYGIEDFVTDVEGEINDTQDIGCMSPPCGFENAMSGHIGPFLRWTNWETTAPEGYIGNPGVLHTVEGGTSGENVFRVEGPIDDEITAPTVMETNMFSVTGKLAQLKTTIDKPGDLYGNETNVKIQSSFPAESDIIYTTDGSEPSANNGIRVASDGTATSAAAVVIPGPAIDPATGLPVGTPRNTVLKYIAIDSTGTSAVTTQNYTVDTSLPVVTATNLGVSVSPGVLKGPQRIELTAAVASSPDTASTIYYTTDGTRPRLEGGAPAGTTLEYTGPFMLSRSNLVSAIAVTDGDVQGPLSTTSYNVRHLDVISEPGEDHPFPVTVSDYGAPATEENGNRALDPVELALCLNDTMCGLESPFDQVPVKYPDRFPGEAFWWSADAELPIANGGRARLVLALEAAFANEVPREGDEVAFGRTRYDLRGMTPGVTYRITQPYGVDVLTADTEGDLRYTNDVGCLDVHCSFDLMAQAGIGPVLRQLDAPAGYLGDGAQAGPVVGSPFDTNYFEVEAITDAAGNSIDPVSIGRTTDFTVVGRLSSTTPPTLPGTVATAETPVVDVAAAPRIGEAVVQLAAADDGGSPVTGFVVRAIDPAGSQIGALRTADATATSLTVTGLRADLATRFQVAAINANGQGPFSLPSAELAALPAPFPDVPQGIQFFTEMAWLADSEITTGWDDGTFRPVTPVNRDAMAAFLYRMAGEPTYRAPAVSPFKDVKPGMEHYKEMAWLAEQGISKGWDDGTFRPTTPVNRDAMAAFLYRMVEAPTNGSEPATFPDVTKDNQFFKEISWLASTGITTGYPDGTFKPVQSVNRDAMAAFLYRFDVL
ncbi:S-layer homology domain-containing protein [uncultured Arthrobacter sp.]|uniref:S-layer homology domain-containing protein n=1 Tax=uncultured Arthrobacter sp. TaxID=114050 RepID=UPI00263514CE|nr:S-layer homology domain-containing protein [uncultured Arthrobacter sp.]